MYTTQFFTTLGKVFAVYDLLACKSSGEMVFVFKLSLFAGKPDSGRNN